MITITGFSNDGMGVQLIGEDREKSRKVEKLPAAVSEKAGSNEEKWQNSLPWQEVKAGSNQEKWRNTLPWQEVKAGSNEEKWQNSLPR